MFPLAVSGKDLSRGPILRQGGYCISRISKTSTSPMRNRRKEKRGPNVCNASFFPSLPSLPRSAIRDRRRCVLRSGMIMRQRKVCLGAPETRTPLPPYHNRDPSRPLCIRGREKLAQSQLKLGLFFQLKVEHCGNVPIGPIAGNLLPVIPYLNGFLHRPKACL